MNDNIKAGADINAGDGGYSLGTQEKYDEFVKGRNQSLGKMRIKTLMREAGTDVSGKWMGIDNAEKFAELIVKECIEVVGRATASPNGYQALMKHFGVEE
jgi:hypothetical protein